MVVLAGEQLSLSAHLKVRIHSVFQLFSRHIACDWNSHP